LFRRRTFIAIISAMDQQQINSALAEIRRL
jgi:hypothetical protein